MIINDTIKTQSGLVYRKVARFEVQKEWILE